MGVISSANAEKVRERLLHTGSSSCFYESLRRSIVHLFLSGPTEVQDWSMESGAEVIERLYKFEIAKTYKGKYGNFTIVQDVYATELEDGWRVLWDYNK
ncbi:hypothetical protein [Piscibacillus salipiscarius]|uniref:hypothetical protein n=1 Tax=Piscibacillus salipiscarius TaxID=299480 RepID=UPI0006CF2887|nr:hypothetical protein [Piscibacillus salipiscarius]